jgi:hypothetical protein
LLPFPPHNLAPPPTAAAAAAAAAAAVLKQQNQTCSPSLKSVDRRFAYRQSLLVSLAPHSDFFTISGTSVSALQCFLDHAPDMTVRQSLQLMRPHLTGITPADFDSILVANEWEVA